MKLLFWLLLMFNFDAYAEVDLHEFKDKEQQQNYKSLIEELRCLVCQNQTIADSNAELANDLRRQVYEMLQQGKTRQDIADFMIARYGDFVLYKPPLKTKTILLWAGPAVFLLIGLLLVFLFSRRNRSDINASLDPKQHDQIQKLLEQDIDS